MRILMYGDFNFQGGPFDGATTKTRNIYEALKEKYGQISFFNIEGWRKNPIKKIVELKKAVKNIDAIVFVPGAKNGTYFALYFFGKLKKKRNIKIYYFIAGSMLPHYLMERPKYIQNVKLMDGVFCETNGLISELKQLGVSDNLFLSPTFDLRGRFDFTPRKIGEKNVYNFCSFSRVNKLKGISIGIEAITEINANSSNNIIIYYDIYGKVDEAYKEEMNHLISNADGKVRYMGLIPDNQVIKTLSKYDATIFASYFEGECLPATVLESLKASTPLLISDWKYNREIIDDGIDGFVFGNTKEDLIKTILSKCKTNNPFSDMRINCYKKSQRYTKEICLHQLYEMLGE